MVLDDPRVVGRLFQLAGYAEIRVILKVCSMPIGIDQKRIEDLIARPTESLNVEIKRWIDPETPNGEAKIARAALALRNRNGGFLLVGFDDKTLQPDAGHEPADVRATFHIDKIQGIVSRYASELFEIGVGFAEREGVIYPVIVVPEGVVVPVAAKSNLKDGNGKILVRAHEVYFRTLGSNGTVSSASARSSDWREIVEICFENREADIGRFLRRHLGGRDIVGALTQFATAVPALQPPPTLRESVEELLKSGEKRFLAAVDRRTLGAQHTRALRARPAG